MQLFLAFRACRLIKDKMLRIATNTILNAGSIVGVRSLHVCPVLTLRGLTNTTQDGERVVGHDQHGQVQRLP